MRFGARVGVDEGAVIAVEAWVGAVDRIILKAGSMLDSTGAAVGGVVVAKVGSIRADAGPLAGGARASDAASRRVEASALCVGIFSVLWTSLVVTCRASATPDVASIEVSGAGGSRTSPCSMVRTVGACSDCDGPAISAEGEIDEDTAIGVLCRDSASWVEGLASGARGWASDGVGVEVGADWSLVGTGTATATTTWAGAGAGVVDFCSAVADRSGS